MDQILLQISGIFGTDQTSVLVWGIGILWVLISFLFGLGRVYSLFIGLATGIGLYIILSVLLSGVNGNTQVSDFLGPQSIQFILSTCIYLIFILMILGAVQGELKIHRSKQIVVHIFSHIGVALFFYFFLFGVCIALIEKKYIFSHTTYLNHILGTPWYTTLQKSAVYLEIDSHIAALTTLGVLFIVYRLLFADFVNALLAGIIHGIQMWIEKKSGSKSHSDEHNDDHGHDSHGHEDHHDEGDAGDHHESHDDHGHDSHGHGHH